MRVYTFAEGLSVPSVYQAGSEYYLVGLMPSLKRFRSRRGIAIIAGLAVIVIVGIGVHEFSSRTMQSIPASPPPAVPVTAATATRKDVPEIIDAIGNVQSIDSVSVVPRVTEIGRAHV